MSHRSKVVVIVTVIGLICACAGLLVSKFGKPLTIRDPVKKLNTRFSKDFGASLPAGAKVINAYWVFVRDPEEVFEVEMKVADLVALVDQIMLQSNARRFRLDESDVSRCRPLYGAPVWWNSPRLPDAKAMTISVTDSTGVTVAGYGIVWSPGTGHAFIYWGAF